VDGNGSDSHQYLFEKAQFCRYARTRAAQTDAVPLGVAEAAAMQSASTKLLEEGVPVTATPRANEMYEKQIKEMMDHVVMKDSKICAVRREGPRGCCVFRWDSC
jgi:hypothetical protein